MSTHNICFRREIIKILCGYPLLSVAMAEAKADLSLRFAHVSEGTFSHLAANFIGDDIQTS